MTASQFYALILKPAAEMLATVRPGLDGRKSRCLLLAIAGQESSWTARVQVPGGEARGFWQCEQGGMLSGVVFGANFPTLLTICQRYSVPQSITALFEAIAWHDPVAFAVARLGLWMDPNALPEMGDIDGAWDCYERNWRPGKPSRERWNSVYPQAVAVLQAGHG